jgi:PTS system cellobiose-specific IIC component
MSRSSAGSRPSSGAYSAELFRWFEQHAVPVMRRLGDWPFVVAVREALPWSIVGLAAAFAVVLFVAPQSAGTSPSLGLRIAGALLPAFGVMAAVLAVMLPIRFARAGGYAVAPMTAGSVAAFIAALPHAVAHDAVAYLRTVGPSGLFLAMLACGLTAAFAWVLRSRHSPWRQWLAALLAVSFFVLLALVHVSPSALIGHAMQPIARMGDSYIALIVIVLVQSLLWTAGVHGPALLATIVTPVYLTMQMQNTHAYATHAPLPFIVVTSLFLFVFPGGSGSTLPLAAMLSFSKVKHLRRVGRLTIAPAICNINDPLIFGLPIVFNPYLIVPFVVTPLVLATLTYVAVAVGFVARPAFYVPSSVPEFVSTYLATQDVRSFVLVAVNIAIATVLYYPFVRAYERHLEAAPAA